MLWALKTFTFNMNTICFAVLATQYFLPPERLVPSCGWGQGSEDTDSKQMTRQSQAPCLLLQAQCSQNHTATVKPRKLRMRLMKTLFGEVGKEKSNPQMAVSRGCFLIMRHDIKRSLYFESNWESKSTSYLTSCKSWDLVDDGTDGWWQPSWTQPVWESLSCKPTLGLKFSGIKYTQNMHNFIPRM